MHTNTQTDHGLFAKSVMSLSQVPAALSRARAREALWPPAETRAFRTRLLLAGLGGPLARYDRPVVRRTARCTPQLARCRGVAKRAAHGARAARMERHATAVAKAEREGVVLAVG